MTLTKPPLVFDHYTSSNEGIVLTAKQIEPNNALLCEDQRVFDKAKYNTEVHSPLPVFNVNNALDGNWQRCLDMPLRLAGQKQYYVPQEWANLTNVVQQIINVEHAHNKNWEKYNCYLTIDSSIVDVDLQQRNSGLHVDGFQGARIDPKTKITRNYVASNNGGTRFYPQRFNADLDDSRFNIFAGFDLQKQHAVIGPENTVVFMNAYTVHESGIAIRKGQRTFLRITFDLKEFDRQGNTHNGMLPTGWNMITRDVHSMLLVPSAKDYLR